MKGARQLPAGAKTDTGQFRASGDKMGVTQTQKLAAELVGTLWLVLGGCGTAVLAAAFPNVGVGLLGVAFAFGLTVLTMAVAIGHISGCHLNPAVTVGLWTENGYRLLIC